MGRASGKRGTTTGAAEPGLPFEDAARVEGPGGPIARPALSGRRLPSDEAAREVARADLARSHVVEAGAGTGKTTVLVERVLALVGAPEDTPLERVVAITFTEKAAGELKVRLRARLEEEAARSEGVDDERSERLRAALAALDRAPIETIHAFAARLLRERPVEAGVDPRFDTLDELRRDLLIDELWEAWLGETLAGSPEVLRKAFTAGLLPKAWRELALLLVDRRTSAPAAPAPAPAYEPPAPAAPPPDAAAWLAVAAGRLAGLHATLARVALDPEDRLLARLGPLAEEARAFAGGPAIDAEAYVLRDLELPGRNVGRREGYRDADALARAKDDLMRLAREHETIRGALAERLLRELLDRLGGFVARYEEAKRERGLVDFDDLLLAARDLLLRRPEARCALARRYTHLLVDEFQDTDPLQAEIVFLLADEEGGARGWREARVPPGRLFLVGDPKQSIYRFRRADLELYEEAKRLALGGEDGGGGRAALAITENFRSDAGLLEWVNAVFEGEMRRPEGGALYQPDYRPLTPYHTGVRGARSLVVLRPAPGTVAEGIKVAEQRRLEAKAVAGLVRRAVEEGWEVRGADGRPRPARFGDVALLFRAMTGVEAFEDALRRAEVPYRVAGGKDYYRRAEVQALLRLLEAVDDPEDVVAVVAALRLPFFGVSDTALLAHRRAGGRFAYLAPEGAPAGGGPGGPRVAPSSEPAIAEAFACLAELRALRHALDPAALVREALARTHGAAISALKPHGEQRVANLFKLADEAAALGGAGVGTLRGAVRWLAEAESREVEESESPLAEEEDDAVRLMTVHKAKGLEFPVVVLADLASERRNEREKVLADPGTGRLEARVGLPGRPGKPRPIETAGYAPLGERERMRFEAESLRLLYVAATRARDVLVVPVWAPKPAAVAAYRPLLGHLPGLGEPVPGGLSERAVVIGAETLPEPEDPGPFRRRLVPPFDGGAVARARLAAREAWRRERAAALARAGAGVRFVRPSKAAEAAADLPAAAERAIEGARQVPAGVGVLVGLAVHAALERAPLGDPEAVAQEAEAAARAAALPAEARARVVRLARAAAGSRVAREAAAAPSHAREAPFAVTLEGVRVEGSADLVYERDGALVVADWKTDAIGRASRERAAVLLARYRAQALLYALAIEAAAGRPVREAVLVFADGRGGTVEEVRIAFDEAARAEARALLGDAAGRVPPRP